MEGGIGMIGGNRKAQLGYKEVDRGAKSDQT